MSQRIVIANQERNLEAGLQKITQAGHPVWQAWVRDVKQDVVHLVVECVNPRTLVRLLQAEGFFKPV